MKIFTVNENKVTLGTELTKLTTADGQHSYMAVTVGEKGRGRDLGVITVELANKQATETRICYAELAKTLKGDPKFKEVSAPTTADAAIVVIRTMYGFRGSIVYSGDADGTGRHKPFPCQILAEGRVAQGLAGRAGGGQQLIIVAKKGEVFRIERTGRDYGRTMEYFYMFDGNRVMCATAEERDATGYF